MQKFALENLGKVRMGQNIIAPGHIEDGVNRGSGSMGQRGGCPSCPFLNGAARAKLPLKLNAKMNLNRF